MKQVLDFLTQSKVFFLATTDGQRPHVRPLGFVMEHEGKLAFCTSNQKEMYRQMQANPYVEISCVNAAMDMLRLTGKAVFATTEDAQRKALQAMPVLEGMYAVGDGKFEIFVLEEASAVLSTMGGESKTLPL